MLSFRIAIILSLLTAGSKSFAQSIQIKIEDSKNKTPLSSAVVLAENSDKKQFVGITGEDGTCTIDVSLPCFVTVHYLGYPDVHTQLHSSDTTIILTSLENSLNEVVITGEYNINTSDKSVYNVRVLDSKQIEAKQSSTLADLLNTQLNIRLNQDNILGTGISINGLSGQNVKILIDGVPVIGRENGNINLSQILLNDVERIEIIEGPASVMYGTDAIGGLINIITKQNSPSKVELTLNSLYETDGRYNIDGNAFFKMGSDHFSANGGRYFFDGFSNPDTGRWQEWKPYEQHFLGVEYGLKSQHTDAQFKLKYFHETTQNKGVAILNPYEAYAFDEYYLTDRYDASWIQSVRLTRNLKIDFTNAYSNYSRIRNTYRKDLVALTQELVPLSSMQDSSLFQQFVFRGNFSRILPVKKINFMFGYDVNLENGRGEKLLDEKQSLNDYALFMSAQLKLNRFTLRPSLRGGFNSRYDEPLIPAFNLVFNPDDSWAIRTGYSRGFRAPSLKELDLLFVDVNHNIHGNPDLKAEDSHHFVFSADYNQRIEKSVVHLGSSLSFNSIHNVITLAQTDASSNFYTYINIDKYRTISGALEISYGYQPFSFGSGFSLTALYNSLSETNDKVPIFSYSPEWNLNTTFEWKKLNAMMNIQLKVTGTTFGYALDDSSNVYQTQIASYSMLDANITKNILKKRIIATLGGKNLLNVQDIKSTGVAGVHSADTGSIPNSTGRFIYINLALKIFKQ